MGELIQLNFGKPNKDIDGQTGEWGADAGNPVTVRELYRKVTALELTPATVSSLRQLLAPYTFEQLAVFMAEITREAPIKGNKLVFLKAVQQAMKHKEPQKPIP